jgi:hypothetical protein
LYVAVFRLVDGSSMAIGVGYPGVGTTPVTIDYGPSGSTPAGRLT